MRGNPFPGPQAFDAARAKFFYGRRKELRILAGLAAARRASLLFSPSGAGKSSLINAGLIPALTERKTTGHGRRQRSFQKMYLVGSASVGGEPRGVNADNTYVYLTLQSLLPAMAPEQLADQRLAEGLAPLQRPEELGEGTPGLLILDQFEELFTRNVDRWRERADFFAQLSETLERHPDLHLLLSMREEYIAELTPFAGLLPERLQSRYRLERLQRDAALEAVDLPAAEASCPFASAEVAEKLVDNLLGGGSGEDGDGAEGSAAPGEFVEPVHLQIVCRQLWEGLEEGSTAIHHEDLVTYADVDEALRAFYEAGLRSALEADGARVRENALRDWFDKTNLITPSRTRGLVLAGDETTEGVPNEAVERLENAYLIRRTRRGSDAWFELAHDRLIEPILKANAAWRRDHLKPVTVAAEAWSGAEEDPRRLWSGPQLRQVRADARGRPGEYSQLEERFIAASAARQRRRRARLGGLVLLLLALAVSGLWLGRSLRESARQRAIAEQMEYLSGIRLARRQLDSARRVEAAETLWATPEGQRNWEWGVLLAQSHAWLLDEGDADLVDTAFSPAVEDRRIAAVSVAGTALLWDAGSGEKLLEMPACEPAAAASGDEAPGAGFHADVRFSGDGRRLLTFCGSGPARVWDTATGERLAEADWTGRKLLGIDRGRVLAIHDDDAEVWQWDGEQDETARRAFAADGGVTAAAFCGEDWLVTGSETGEVELWDVASGKRRPTGSGHDDAVEVLACDPAGGRLVSGSGDKTVRVWAVSARGALRPEEPRQDLPQGKRLKYAAFSGDGRYLVTVYQSRTTVWSVPRDEDGAWEDRNTLKGYRVSAARFSPDGRSVLAEASGSAVLWRWAAPGDTTELKGPEGDSIQAAFSPDGARLLTRFPGQSVLRVWEVAESSPRTRWEFDELVAAAEGPAGDGIRVVTEDGSVRLRAAAGEEVQELAEGLPEELSQELSGEFLKAAAFSPDGRKLVTAFENATLVWSRASTDAGGWQEPLTLVTGHVESAAFSPDGARIVTTSERTASLWDAAAGGEPLVTLEGHEQRVVHAAFAPDGRRVVTASEDNTARVWDATTGLQVAVLDKHDGGVGFAAFSPDGGSVVTAAEDWTARLWQWQAAGDKERATLVGHEGRVTWAAFSPDGSRILTASDADGSVRIWNREGAELAVIPGFKRSSSARFVAEPPALLIVDDKRVDLLTVFPFRPEQLPGDPGAGWRERFRLFESRIR